jgi:hypothetical protein
VKSVRPADRGSVTLWSLGLAVIVLALGVLSLDLWSVLAARQELVAIADATSFAAASGIDEERLRADGSVILDPEAARERARVSLEGQDLPSTWRGWEMTIESDHVEVTVSGHVEGVLLPLIGFEGLDMTVTSRASPVLRS